MLRQLLPMLGAALAWSACAAPPTAIEPYYQFVHWTSVGRLDRALEQFADDALVVAGPTCTDDSPCIGKAAIARWYLPLLREGALPLPIIDQRFDGTQLRTRGETVLVLQPPDGPVVLKGGHRIDLWGDHIVALRFELDAKDAATAAWIARQAAARVAAK